MAKFKQQYLRLKDNQKIQFGDSQDASIWWDGADLLLDSTICGITPIQDTHLTTKLYVDTEISAIGTLIGLSDTPSGYSNGLYLQSTTNGTIWTAASGPTGPQGEPGPPGGVTTLSGLSDTPNVYDDGKYLKSTTDGTEWSTVTQGGGLTELSDDTSPALGGNLELGSYNINYGSILTADSTYRGEIMTVVVSDASTVFGSVLYCAGDFQYARADADSTSNSPAFVMALETGTGSKKVLLRGQICKTSWSWSSDKLWLSTTTGGMTQVVPQGTGDQVQPLAWALSANTIFFAGSITHGEVA